MNFSPHIPKSGLPVVIVIILLVTLFTSCGLFETRNPESPEGITNFWTPPVDPADVLDNINMAFSLHDASLYMKSFAKPDNADSLFRFYPDMSTIGYDTTLFTQWGYYDEDAFIRNLFSPDFLPSNAVAMIEFIAESEEPGENTPVYRESYTITLQLTDLELPQEYSGKANIRFDRDYNSNWVIISWEDEASGDNPSITQLKSIVSN